jgi:hypothetical protein
MKAKIRIDITHTAREDQVPEMEFTRTSMLSLELPLDSAAFLEAVETLTTNNLSNMINRLCAGVMTDGERYVEAMKKAGIKQPELPFEEQAALPPGEQAVLPAGEQGA